MSGIAFERLLHELKRAEARHLAMVALDHLDGLPITRDVLLQRLRDETRASIWLLDPATEIITLRGRLLPRQPRSRARYFD